MLHRVLKSVSVAVAVAASFLWTLPAYAAELLPSDLNQQIKDNSGLQETSVPIVAAKVVNVFLTVLGIITLIVILYAGFLWMTAGGKEDQVKKARMLLRNAVIALIIILASYSIGKFAFDSIYKATTAS